MASEKTGWHFGPSGEHEDGFLPGTAFQPDDIQDHLDAWGTPHPGDLAHCPDCQEKIALPTAGDVR